METTPFALLPLWGSTPAALRSVYLERLRRLQRLRLQHEQELNTQGLRLLDRSAFAAYCVLRDVGAGEEALAVLRDASAGGGPSPAPVNPSLARRSPVSSRGLARRVCPKDY